MDILIYEDIKIGSVVEIARAADKAILEIYDDDDFGISFKEGTSQKNEPLTAADRAANKIIVDGLKALCPNIPIISEENEQIPYEIRKDFEFYWVVDPLDGTKEFIKKNGQFTVNIALCKGNAPVAGVVTVPVTGVAYWAVQNKGAYKQDKSANGPKQIYANKFKEDDANLTLIGSRSHLNEETKKWIAKYKDPKILEMGSSLKFMMVAEGSADIYPRIAPTCEWDTCASQIIVEESGGVVLRIEEGDFLTPKGPLTYNKPNTLNPWFVTYGHRL